MDIDHHLESMMRKEQVLKPRYGRGFHVADVHKAAEELRHEHAAEHSYDPIYENSKKNK